MQYKYRYECDEFRVKEMRNNVDDKREICEGQDMYFELKENRSF